MRRKGLEQDKWGGRGWRRIMERKDLEKNGQEGAGEGAGEG